MGSNIYQKSSRNRYLKAKVQKLKIEKNYEFISCNIKNGELKCKGEVSPNGCEKYKFKILYKVGNIPKVFILNPKIKYHADIHIYKEGNLCLYYPRDMPWNDHIQIAETFIPWMIEWIIYFEIWKITKKWLGKSAPHKNTK